jgi:triphosphoribosyl-dephospho-CoA synthetase
MRVDPKPFCWSGVDHMNARRAAKPASGGRNYAKRDRLVNKAAERERIADLDAFERIREEAHHRFEAIRTETREAFARLRPDYRPEDDIPF